MTAERPVSFPPRAQPERDASEDAKAAALRGASLAFGKPILKPKPDLHNYSGNNGALAAATKSASRSGNGEGAGGRQRLLSMQELLQGEKDAARLRGIEESSRIRRQNSGSSVASERVGNGGAGRGRGRGVVQQRPSEYSFGTNDGEGGNVTKLLRPDQSRSTSFIAATLAASRSASVSPNPTGTLRQPLSPAEMRIPPRYGSRSPSVGSADSSRGSLDQALDTRPIPPTGSLIGMFEQNAGKTGTGKTPRFNTPTSMQQTVGLAHSASATPMEIRSPNPLSSGPRKAPPQLKLPQPQIPQQPLTQATSISTSSVPSTRKAKPSPEGQARKPSLLSSKPIPIPSKSPASAATSKVTATLKDDDASSDDSFVSAPDYSYKPSWRAELASQNGRLTSASIASVNSAVTVDSLANAIVASSLASSRAGSPSKYLQPTSTLYPPLSPPQRTKHHHHTRFFHNGKDLSRTPSPSKNGNGVGGGMLRTTMRKVKSKEEIGEGEKRRGKKNLVKKHPNKHHEGDRKRWRDSITERERKRYEAVWASNRGLYTSSSPVSASTTSLPITNANGLEKPAVDPPSEVCSLVVRDIFSRSRLNTDVLEEAYALVDRRGIGSLGKEEFVVGLWLVDQRLKGRKLPIRVSESVWKSVGVLSGIKVRKVNNHH